MTQRSPYPFPGSRRPDRSEELYVNPPPWDLGRPQPAFRALAEAGAVSGRVLDFGCRTGEHALMAATLGLDATGVDLAGNAPDQAETKACDRGLAVWFVHHDAPRLADLGEEFDTVLDCGLFHIFTGADRAAYIDSPPLSAGARRQILHARLQRPQPGEWGPQRLPRPDIANAFADGWRIDSLEPATIELTIQPPTVHAWLDAVTRL